MIKTFKIGESAKGGIIQVSTRPRNVFEVKVMDYNTKEPLHWRFVYGLNELESYLEQDITTSFWAEKITTYFKSKTL